CQQDYRWPLTF
nr:immunoglobulin light chain junction region [Macaca mulatta]